MKIISIINLKGGVAKTLTADNMAHVLAVFHNKRVLLVDNDKQGNTSKGVRGPFLRRKEPFRRSDRPAVGRAGGHQKDPVREYRRIAR